MTLQFVYKPEDLKKYDFFTTEVKFLGFMVSTNGVVMDQR